MFNEKRFEENFCTKISGEDRASDWLLAYFGTVKS